MKFEGIKTELGVTTLPITRSNKCNESDSTTQWYSALLEDKVISVHADTVASIETEPECDTFGLKSMGPKKSAKGFEYELLILVKYKEQKYDKVL